MRLRNRVTFYLKTRNVVSSKHGYTRKIQTVRFNNRAHTAPWDIYLLMKIPPFSLYYYFPFFQISALCVPQRGIAFIAENRYGWISDGNVHRARVKRYVRDGLRLKKRNETRREREGGGGEEGRRRRRRERSRSSKWFIKRSRRNREAHAWMRVCYLTTGHILYNIL